MSKGEKKDKLRVLFKTPLTDIQPNSKPISMAPLSPMKILAGYLLYLKKPHALLSNVMASSVACMLFVLKAMIPNAKQDIQVMPVAKPSIPSIKLNALMTAMIHSRVMG